MFLELQFTYIQCNIFKWYDTDGNSTQVLPNEIQGKGRRDTNNYVKLATGISLTRAVIEYKVRSTLYRRPTEYLSHGLLNSPKNNPS